MMTHALVGDVGYDDLCAEHQPQGHARHGEHLHNAGDDDDVDTCS